MAGLFGATTKTVTTPRYTSINVQTSSEGLPIPIGYAEFRAGWNLLWVGKLKSVPAGGGAKSGKGGPKGNSAQYNYSIPMIAGICEGPISDVHLVYINQGYSTVAGQGLTIFTGTQTQSPPGFISSGYSTEALAYAGTAYLFASDLQLGSSPSMPSLNFLVRGKYYNTVPGFPQANPADIVTDYITNTQYGLDPNASYIDSSITNFRNYCQALPMLLAPYLNTQEQAVTTIQRWATLTNTWIFWSGNVLKFVPLGDTAITNGTTGGTYTPNMTPVYNLTYDHFIFNPENEDPITITIKDPLDGYNIVELDILDETNDYNSVPIRWQDQTSIDQNGQLNPQVVQASEITDLNMASISAQLIGRRAVNINKTYAFKLPFNFILLEPGDIVTLTDSNVGLIQFAVRITEITEDDKDVLSFVSEESPASNGTAAQFASTPYGGRSPINLYAIPSSVNNPAIYEPDPVITAGNPELWIGASGQNNWGGAIVFLSTDGTNYVQAGQITNASIQGTLVNPLPTHTDPDTTNTLTIDTTESGITMSTAVTTAMADAFQTSSLINNEVLAYGNVALVSGNQFALTYLRRGIYGTVPASHLAGDQFTLLSPTTAFIFTLPQSYVGVTIYVKLCSFNQFGNEAQDISTVTAYTYTPTGVAYSIAAPGNLHITAANIVLPGGATSIAMQFSWNASSGPMLAYYIVQWSTDNTNWTGITTAALNYTLTSAQANTNYWLRVAAVSESGLATSAFVTVGPINSGSVVVNLYPPSVTEGRVTFLPRRTHLQVPAFVKPVL